MYKNWGKDKQDGQIRKNYFLAPSVRKKPIICFLKKNAIRKYGNASKYRIPLLREAPTAFEFAPSVAIFRHIEHCAKESSAKKITNAIKASDKRKYLLLNFTR
jgi:hypothetical protein